MTGSEGSEIRLPVRFGRRFRMYAYSPSFARLFLHSDPSDRAADTDEYCRFIELVFHSVLDLKLPVYMGALTIRRPVVDEVVRIREDIARDVDPGEIFVLQHDGHLSTHENAADGYVVARMAYFTRSQTFVDIDRLMDPMDDSLEFVTIVD
ncbi:hypothetical protein [Nocardia sp. NBC_01388]|uniref:hypothetical protein n=1 Tax=Nocardia sp. NBC_01388 TaxID=2903596 RepID=UPI00324958B9